MVKYPKGICHTGTIKQCGLKIGPTLEDRVSHSLQHHSNSPAEWSDAYTKMLEWREREKKTSSHADTDS